MSYLYMGVYLRLDVEKTTAKHKVHFINRENVFEYGDGVNVFTEVELIPENITSEVEIAYKIQRSVGYKPQEGKIYTTTIRLIPKSKK